MSDATKTYYLNVKDLGYKSLSLIDDMMRFLTEQIPQLQMSKDGNEIEVVAPEGLSKRAIKLRLKKFLYRKSLTSDFRPIFYKSGDKTGYQIKERKSFDFSYY